MKRKFFLVFFCAVLAFASQAAAYSVTPDTGVLNATRWQGDQTGQSQIDAIINPIIFPSVELYKADVGEADSGSLSDYYHTVFSNTPTDPAEATISWVGNPGDPFVGPIAYLLVKDGNANPAWYLFNLTALTAWDGKDTLYLSGFWPDQGAISHVTLYGGAPVPIPAAAWLLGSGIVGLIAIRRRAKK